MKKVRIERYGDSVGIEFEASLHFQVWTVSAETPHGKRFAATGTHVVKLPGDGCCLPYRPDWNEVYKELKSTVNFGIVDCPSDCEHCKGLEIKHPAINIVSKYDLEQDRLRLNIDAMLYGNNKKPAK